MLRNPLFKLAAVATCVATLAMPLPAMADEIPAISKYTESMQVQQGFVPFYYDEASGKLYVSVKSFNQPMLFHSAMPHGLGSNDIGLDRGQLGDTRLVQFERYGNKVLLKQLNTAYRASASNAAERQSVDEAFADSVLAGFKIVARTDDQVLIDYTPFLLSDIHQVGPRLDSQQQGSYAVDPKRSAVYPARTKAFADNTELEAVVTYAGSKPGQYVRQVAPEPTSLTVHLHHSFVRLPDDGYQPRPFHPYSGYWKTSHFDYSAAIDAPLEQRYITRHRLHKKDPEAERSEPVEPIVYYLDPGVPEQIAGALTEGARWWNQAFDAIGYDNAFVVKTLPADADPMDARYNVIQWVHRATRGWSYGSSVVDPRTGEIIKGHVTLGSLRVRQDYLIALGLTSPFDSENPDTSRQQDMALARIAQLSAHEIGHTLGLAHNFAASENSRASVMDYPHPLIRFKNGQVDLSQAYDSGMGAWDKHAIAYGYQDYADDASMQNGLAAQIEQARQAGLAFKTDFDTRNPASASADGHMWDNGGDPLAAYEQIVGLRSRALDNLGQNTLREGEALSALESYLVPVYLLHRYQLQAVAKQVGGVHYSYELKGDHDSPKGVSMVPAQQQKAAIKQLIASTSPAFLRMPDKVLSLLTPTAFGQDISREDFASRMGTPLDPVTAAASTANYSLELLLSPQRLNRLAWQASQQRGIPGVDAVVTRLFETHWYANTADYGLNQRLAMVALNAVMRTLKDDQLAPEVRADMQAVVMKFTRWLADESELAAAPVLHQQLLTYWQTGNWPGAFEVPALPPGSPI